MIQTIVRLEYEALFHLARDSPTLRRKLCAGSLFNYDKSEPRLIIRLNLLAGYTYFPEFNCQVIDKLAILKPVVVNYYPLRQFTIGIAATTSATPFIQLFEKSTIVQLRPISFALIQPSKCQCFPLLEKMI